MLNKLLDGFLGLDGNAEAYMSESDFRNFKAQNFRKIFIILSENGLEPTIQIKKNFLNVVMNF